MKATIETAAPAVTGERLATTRGFFKGLLFGVMVLGIALVLASFVVPRIIGAVPLTVLTGSMKPTFNPGDLIVTMPVDAEDVKRGDVVTFQPESGVNTLITHRVQSVGFTLSGETLLITQGDANTQKDDPIVSDQVLGKYLYHIPYLGFLANALPADNKPLIMQLLGVAVFGWVGLQIIRMILSGRRAKRRAAHAMEQV